MGDMDRTGMRAGADAADAAADRGGEVGHRADDRRIAHQPGEARPRIAGSDREDVSSRRQMLDIIGQDIVDQLRLHRGNDAVESLVGDLFAVGDESDLFGHIATGWIDHGDPFGPLDPLRK
jgi:hypothetical protein